MAQQGRGDADMLRIADGGPGHQAGAQEMGMHAHPEELPGTPGHDVVDLVVAERPSERRDPHPADPGMIVQEHRTPMLEITLEGSRQLARQRYLERLAILHLGTSEPQDPDLARALE